MTGSVAGDEVGHLSTNRGQRVGSSRGLPTVQGPPGIAYRLNDMRRTYSCPGSRPLGSVRFTENRDNSPVQRVRSPPKGVVLSGENVLYRLDGAIVARISRPGQLAAGRRGVGPATEPFRTLRRFRRGQDGCLRGSLAYVPVPVQPGCDLECKNWIAPAGYAELAVFNDKLTSRGRPSVAGPHPVPSDHGGAWLPPA